MAETVPYTATHAERFARLTAELEQLSSLRGKPFSLRDIFNHDGFDIEDYCRGYTPNRHERESRAVVRQYAENHGIWLAGTSDHVTDMGA
jgi:hypothetical protein